MARTERHGGDILYSSRRADIARLRRTVAQQIANKYPSDMAAFKQSYSIRDGAYPGATYSEGLNPVHDLSQATASAVLDRIVHRLEDSQTSSFADGNFTYSIDTYYHILFSAPRREELPEEDKRAGLQEGFTAAMEVLLGKNPEIFLEGYDFTRTATERTIDDSPIPDPLTHIVETVVPGISLAKYGANRERVAVVIERAVATNV